jgi:hypothetical protein
MPKNNLITISDAPVKFFECPCGFKRVSQRQKEIDDTFRRHKKVCTIKVSTSTYISDNITQTLDGKKPYIHTVYSKFQENTPTTKL